MPIVEFRLAMTGKGSWNNRWSGEGRNYTLDRELDEARATQLDGSAWSYSWPDGWRATIHARRVPTDEVRAPSHGFHGYDWMVASILRDGRILADHERPVPATEEPVAADEVHGLGVALIRASDATQP